MFNDLYPLKSDIDEFETFYKRGKPLKDETTKWLEHAAGYWVDIRALTWMMSILGILALLSVMRKKLIIDIHQREIHAKVGLARPEVVIPIDSIRNFENDAGISTDNLHVLSC